MSGADALAHLFESDSFRTSVWAQRPYVGRDVAQDEELSPGDITRLLNGPLSPDFVRIAEKGSFSKVGPRTRMADTATANIRLLDLTDLAARWRAGATLLLQAADELFPVCHRLRVSLAEAFLSKVPCALFLTPLGHEGFEPHVDGTHGFLIQLHGEKTWRVWSPVEPDPTPGRGELHYGRRPPLLSVTLRRGDLLYIPAGFPHAAASTGTSFSAHVTLSVTADSDFLNGIVRTRMRDVWPGSRAELLAWAIEQLKAESALVEESTPAARVRSPRPTFDLSGDLS